jgi:hypothetical protein
MGITSQIDGNKKQFDQMGSELKKIESQITATIIQELKAQNPGRNRDACDKILGHYYTPAYLVPYIAMGMASRVAHHVSSVLVPAILDLEKKMSTEFHKGALFYNTAIAYLLSGNDDGCEYFLAMTDEEDAKTSAGNHKRGTTNQRSGELGGPTILNRLKFARNILNGTIAGSPLTYSLLTARAAITESQLDIWRKKFDSLH